MRKMLASVILLAAVLTGACGGSDDSNNDTAGTAPAGGAKVIKSSGTLWTPDEITVKAGTTVTWKVEKGLEHDLSGEDGVKHEKGTAFTYTHTYADAGTYSYQCTLHGGMDGTVTVQ